MYTFIQKDRPALIKVKNLITDSTNPSTIFIVISIGDTHFKCIVISDFSNSRVVGDAVTVPKGNAKLFKGKLILSNTSFNTKDKDAMEFID